MLLLDGDADTELGWSRAHTLQKASLVLQARLGSYPFVSPNSETRMEVNCKIRKTLQGRGSWEGNATHFFSFPYQLCQSEALVY